MAGKFFDNWKTISDKVIILSEIDFGLNSTSNKTYLF